MVILFICYEQEQLSMWICCSSHVILWKERFYSIQKHIWFKLESSCFRQKDSYSNTTNSNVFDKDNNGGIIKIYKMPDPLTKAAIAANYDV